jgi:hypothetical protein
MEPISGANSSLSFSFYHGDWEDAIISGQQYDYFTQDIRNHNYNDFLNGGKIIILLTTNNCIFPITMIK